MAGGSLSWLRDLRAESEGLSLKQREVLDRAEARVDQLQALQRQAQRNMMTYTARLEEAVRESELGALQSALASAREWLGPFLPSIARPSRHGGDEDLFQKAQNLLDRLSAAAALASARDAWATR